jgi:hypothetical protein
MHTFLKIQEISWKISEFGDMSQIFVAIFPSLPITDVPLSQFTRAFLFLQGMFRMTIIYEFPNIPASWQMTIPQVSKKAGPFMTLFYPLNF